MTNCLYCNNILEEISFFGSKRTFFYCEKCNKHYNEYGDVL